MENKYKQMSGFILGGPKPDRSLAEAFRSLCQIAPYTKQGEGPVTLAALMPKTVKADHARWLTYRLHGPRAILAMFDPRRCQTVRPARHFRHNNNTLT